MNVVLGNNVHQLSRQCAEKVTEKLRLQATRKKHALVEKMRFLRGAASKTNKHRGEHTPKTLFPSIAA